MKVFVGYGYNDRDRWIEDRLFPILESAGLSVIHGKDMHGQELSPTVKTRIDQSDAAIGFFTLRDGQGDADFTSHIWVRDEIVHALAKGKVVIPVKEVGVKVPDGLIGNRQYIPLDQGDRLACVTEVMRALGQHNLRRVRLTPDDDALRKSIWKWRKEPAFEVRYRTQDHQGVESDWRTGRLETIDQGYYLNLAGAPRRALVEVEGVLNGAVQFSSGWVSADAVQISVS